MNRRVILGVLTMAIGLVLTGLALYALFVPSDMELPANPMRVPNPRVRPWWDEKLDFAWPYLINFVLPVIGPSAILLGLFLVLQGKPAQKGESR